MCGMTKNPKFARWYRNRRRVKWRETRTKEWNERGEHQYDVRGDELTKGDGLLLSLGEPG